MNKSALVAAIAKDADITQAVAQAALDATLANIAGALASGEAVTLQGFGTFGISERAERTGRNPKTGEALTIKAMKLPKFTPGSALKSKVNGN